MCTTKRDRNEASDNDPDAHFRLRLINDLVVLTTRLPKLSGFYGASSCPCAPCGVALTSILRWTLTGHLSHTTATTCTRTLLTAQLSRITINDGHQRATLSRGSPGSAETEIWSIRSDLAEARNDVEKPSQNVVAPRSPRVVEPSAHVAKSAPELMKPNPNVVEPSLTPADPSPHLAQSSPQIWKPNLAKSGPHLAKPSPPPRKWSKPNQIWPSGHNIGRNLRILSKPQCPSRTRTSTAGCTRRANCVWYRVSFDGALDDTSGGEDLDAS